MRLERSGLPVKAQAAEGELTLAREERVARLTRTDEWEIVAADNGVADDCDKWAKQEANALASTNDQLATSATTRPPGPRSVGADWSG